MKLGYFCTYLYQKNFSAYLLFSGIFPQATPLNQLQIITEILDYRKKNYHYLQLREVY